ncbi:hypothetical protein DMH27_04105 [Raoultella planticola]|nr:hypothetical protein [Raoultella planticola]
MFGLPGAEGLVVSRSLNSSPFETKAHGTPLYRGEKGGDGMCLFYHPDHTINLILTSASIIAQHFDYRR